MAGQERLAGRATVTGSRRGSESFEAGARVLGRTGLFVSPVGFGGYRVRDDAPLHRRALADALRGGANLIDTSTNYTDGRSESLVGAMLGSMVQQGELRREQLVVVTKVGYVQGSNLARARQRATPYPDMVEYQDGCWHCIHPEFIVDQLRESLQRLGLQHVDVLLLHNPEYFLSDAANRGIADAQAKFDARCKAAFEQLEALVGDGLISWYGVSSNGFVEPSDETTSTSLDRMLALAEEAGGKDHHFAVAQMPMNLFELGAVTVRRATRAGSDRPWKWRLPTTWACWSTAPSTRSCTPRVEGSWFGSPILRPKTVFPPTSNPRWPRCASSRRSGPPASGVS